MNAELDRFFADVQAHMQLNPTSEVWDTFTRNARPLGQRECLDVDSCDRLVSAAAANNIKLSEGSARRLISLEDSEAGRLGVPVTKNAAGEAPTLISLLMFRHRTLEGGPSKDFSALVRLDEDVPQLATFTVLDRDIPHPTAMAQLASIAYVNPSHLWVAGRIALKPAGVS